MSAAPPVIHDAPAIGAVLAGKYRVDRVLGAGGMAVVLEATHLHLREAVAIKVLQRRVIAHPGSIERFLREARVAMRLRSEHVARVYDVATMEDGTPFIVMELLRGDDLAKRLQDRGPLTVPDAVDYLLQACEALVEAHAAGVVHRDLKPANLFLCTGVDGSPLVKVLDFGVSKLLADDAGAADLLVATAPPSTRSIASARAAASVAFDDTADSAPAAVTRTRAFLGSPHYMAPEQVRSARNVDVRADIWALGVILYELVSGGRPFLGATLDELCAAILEREPSPLVLPGGDRPALRAAIAACLAKDPASRHASVRAFAQAIAPLASGAGSASFERIVRMTPALSDPPPSPGPPPSGGASPAMSPGTAPRRRLPTRALVALALVAAIGGAGAVGARAVVGRRRASSVAGVVPSRCTSSAACTKAGGAPSRCREDGVCVALASEDCSVHADPVALSSDDTVWLGVLLPEGFEADLRAMDLAREDFVGMMSGFTRPGGGIHVHPLGIVACGDERDAMRAARHLVDDVKVPAVLGLGSAAVAVDVGTALLVPESVLGVASISTSPLVTGIPTRPDQPRLMWRTTYSSAETAKAIAHVVPDLLEPQIRALPGVLPREAPMRVAFLREKSRGGPIFDDMLFDALRFNGKSALANGASFREIVFDDSEPGAGAAESALNALRAFAPHVVVFGAPASAIIHVIEPLEESAAPGTYHPRYLWMTAFHQEALDWIGTSAERRRRFFGLQPVATRAVNARFVLHYNEGAAQKVTPTVCPNSSYDAFYLAAYATYALGDQPVSGTNLARAVARLVPPGKPVDVGPAGIFEAFSTLRRGENIDLNGATGSLDFDLAKGEAPFDQALLCVGVDGAGRASGSVESGVVFDSAAGRLEGELRCP